MRPPSFAQLYTFSTESLRPRISSGFSPDTHALSYPTNHSQYSRFYERPLLQFSNRSTSVYAHVSIDTRMALATATTKTFPSSGYIFIITATFRTTTWVINELIWWFSISSSTENYMHRINLRIRYDGGHHISSSYNSIVDRKLCFLPSVFCFRFPLPITYLYTFITFNFYIYTHPK